MSSMTLFVSFLVVILASVSEACRGGGFGGPSQAVKDCYATCVSITTYFILDIQKSLKKIGCPQVYLKFTVSTTPLYNFLCNTITKEKQYLCLILQFWFQHQQHILFLGHKQQHYYFCKNNCFSRPRNIIAASFCQFRVSDQININIVVISHKYCSQLGTFHSQRPVNFVSTTTCDVTHPFFGTQTRTCAQVALSEIFEEEERKKMEMCPRFTLVDLSKKNTFSFRNSFFKRMKSRHLETFHYCISKRNNRR